MEGDVFLPPMEPSTAAQPVYFRKGLIISFTPATGANIVRVGGQNVPNLPILVSGSETALQAGQTVGIMVTGNTMFIVGRVVTPGSAAYGSTASALAASNATVLDFTLPTGYATLVSTSIPVPNWATRATVIATTIGRVNNNQANTINVAAVVYITPGGVFGEGYEEFVGANEWKDLGYAVSDVLTVVPGGTINAILGIAVGGILPPMHGSNAVTISAVAIFTTT